MSFILLVSFRCMYSSLKMDKWRKKYFWPLGKTFQHKMKCNTLFKIANVTQVSIIYLLTSYFANKHLNIKPGNLIKTYVLNFQMVFPLKCNKTMLLRLLSEHWKVKIWFINQLSLLTMSGL